MVSFGGADSKPPRLLLLFGCRMGGKPGKGSGLGQSRQRDRDQMESEGRWLGCSSG